MRRILLTLSAVVALALPVAAQMRPDASQTALRKAVVAANLRKQAAAEQARSAHEQAAQAVQEGQADERQVAARKAWVASKTAEQRKAQQAAVRHPVPLPAAARLARADELAVEKGASRAVRAALRGAVARKAAEAEAERERKVRQWKARHVGRPGTPAVSAAEVQQRKAAAARKQAASKAQQQPPARRAAAQSPTRGAAPQPASRATPKASRGTPAAPQRVAPRSSPGGTGKSRRG